MKILLISPTWKKDTEKKRLRRDKIFKFPPHSLLAVAALTPKDIKIELIDENMEDIDFNKKVDLVGITTMTASAPRAYEIADKFRNRGTKVVLGGYHPTALPEEAKQHADSVVIGNAEGIWNEVMKDASNGKLKPFYFSPPSFLASPLFNGRRKGMIKGIEATRGCPYRCKFFSISNSAIGKNIWKSHWSRL